MGLFDALRTPGGAAGSPTGSRYPYVAKDRFIGDLHFDFMIADPVAEKWYDTTANQEMPERVWCLRHIAAGDIVVDAGAHHGLMSVIFARRVGEAGQVVAYEPLAENVRVLKRNLSLNGLNNVTVKSFGLSDVNGELVADLNLGNAKTADGRPRSPGDEAEVLLQVVRLDDDLQGVQPTLIKVDTEGSDLQSLRGAAATIQACQPTLDLELHLFMAKDRRAHLDEVLQIAHPDVYKFEWLPELFGTIEPMNHDDRSLDAVCEFDNPHLFAEPR